MITYRVKHFSPPAKYGIESNFTYPEGYKVKGIAEQVRLIRELFPSIGLVDVELAEQPLPDGAEGWFAIPRWQTLALTYSGAVGRVLAMIASKRTFNNGCDGQLKAEYLRQEAKTAKMFWELGDEQKNRDILVVPAQFGLRHRGRSVHYARAMFAENEFGLGAFAIGIMLLTHPEREIDRIQLHVQCAGDEFSPNADDDFSFAPAFNFVDGKVNFFAFWYGYMTRIWGSASAFMPQ